MADNETIMDTIRKIRAEADSIEESARGSFKVGETWDGRPFTESDLESALDLAERKRKEADRLEAALKRELSKNVSKNGADFGQLGDCAKLREALRKIKELFRDVDLTIDCPENEAYTIADAALAAPPRNCDVGTAEEQAERFKTAKCDSLPKCKPWDECCLTCFARWSQMPYKEGGAK